jgi:hypothetical protein
MNVVHYRNDVQISSKGVEQMQGSTQTATWHVANWGFWGWVETTLKAVGIIAGILAFVGTMNVTTLTLAGNPRLGAVIITGLFTLAALGIFFVRIQQREIISIIFWLFSFLGHAGLLIALLRVPGLTPLPLVLPIFFILGDLAKQRFLAVSGYTEAGQNTSGMLNFGRVILGIYVVLLIALII